MLSCYFSVITVALSCIGRLTRFRDTTEVLVGDFSTPLVHVEVTSSEFCSRCGKTAMKRLYKVDDTHIRLDNGV